MLDNSVRPFIGWFWIQPASTVQRTKASLYTKPNCKHRKNTGSFYLKYRHWMKSTGKERRTSEERDDKQWKKGWDVSLSLSFSFSLPVLFCCEAGTSLSLSILYWSLSLSLDCPRVPLVIYNFRASEASETLSGLFNWESRIYIY